MTKLSKGSVWRWAAVGYALFFLGVVGGMFGAKRWAISEFSSPQSLRQWENWREDVRQQQAAKSGPVERRVPKSAEPPALVLLRDYFVVMLVGAIIFSSALYWVMMFFIIGLLQSSPQ